MSRRIEFEHNRDHDIVIAKPHWKLETEADVEEWYQQYADYMKRFNRKIDMVIVLDHFDIKPAIGSVFGQYRAKIHQQFTRFNFRVHSTKNVRLFVNTSGARYSVETQEAATVEDAILGILEARQLDKSA